MNLITKVCLVLFFLSSCQGSVGQATFDEEVKVLNDLAYGKDGLQKLNLVLPANNEPAPLLIWIGGGAWSFVDKDVEMDLVRRIAQRGVAVASVGHRLSAATWRDPNKTEGVIHPAHAEDIALSIRWLIDNASDYGYDKTRIFIGGFSSGAHLAMLLALDKRYLEVHQLDPSLFDGVIPVSGAFDIVNYRKVLAASDNPDLATLHVDAVFGDTNQAHVNASPVTYLDQLAHPLLIISDNEVYAYTRLFEDRLSEISFQNIQVTYSYELSHGELWRDMSNNPNSLYRIMIEEFILKTPLTKND